MRFLVTPFTTDRVPREFLKNPSLHDRMSGRRIEKAVAIIEALNVAYSGASINPINCTVNRSNDEHNNINVCVS